MSQWKGVYAFIVTPTKHDGEAIDADGLGRLIDHQIAEGVHGIVVFGSTGGIGSFSEPERESVIDAAVRAAAGRLPVVAGTGAMTTAEAVRLSKFAEKAGAAGILVVPITYWKPTDDELFEHYRRVAAAVSVPVAVYNNPGLTGVEILPPLLRRLSEIDNILYLKDSNKDISRLAAVREATDDKIKVFHGVDATSFYGLIGGAQGWMAGSSNIAPRLCAEIYDAAVTARDPDRAAALFERFRPVGEFMGAKGYIRVAYAALELLGMPMGVPRRPLRPLGEADRESLRLVLEKARLLDRGRHDEARRTG